MTVRACAYSPSGWNAAALFGRRRRTGWWRSAPGRWVICSRASTGECRRKPGGRKRLVDCGMMNQARILCQESRGSPAFWEKIIAMDAAHDDIAALRSALEKAQARAVAAEAEAARAVAQISSTEAIIASLRLEIEKLRREIYGQRSERKARLLEQMEFQLEELEATASEDELAAEKAAAKTTAVKAFTRQRSSRKPFPAHLPRERVVVPAPSACTCCGSTKLAKLGETITETLESVPRQWKVIQTVREKFTCRECEKITQPPAPFHTIPRGWAGPSLLAMILFEKFGQHQPLNRQCERFAREGVEVSLSTLADQVGTCAGVLKPLYSLIETHVLAAERLPGDDTTVPVLAKGKTITGRLWTYVRDDRPFAGPDPPAAIFYYSRNRNGEHPARHLAGYTGILQADAYAGFGDLYDGKRKPKPITEAACWSHGRRKFFVIADTSKAPVALEAVRRIDALFAIEREINGHPADSDGSRPGFRDDLAHHSDLI